MKVVYTPYGEWEWQDAKGNAICTISHEKVFMVHTALDVPPEEAAKMILRNWFGEVFERKYPNWMDQLAKEF